MMRSNIVQYCINNCRNWGRISTRCWIHKSHPIPRPDGQAMGCLLLIFFRKKRLRYNGTALYLTVLFLSTIGISCSSVWDISEEKSPKLNFFSAKKYTPWPRMDAVLIDELNSAEKIIVFGLFGIINILSMAGLRLSYLDMEMLSVER